MEIALSAQVLLLCGCLMARLGTALFHERKLCGRIGPAASWWLAPVKDLLQAVIWALSFLGGNVIWHGQRYRVLRGGKLVRLSFPVNRRPGS